MMILEFNRKIAQVSWESVCNHKSISGLGIYCLSSVNEEIIFK